MKTGNYARAVKLTSLALALAATSGASLAWTGESSFEPISRDNIISNALAMTYQTWSPNATISNWMVGSQYQTFYGSQAYTGVAYTQNYPQQNLPEFLNSVNNTSGGSTAFGNDCSGFVSIAWALPVRYSTHGFGDDANGQTSGNYVQSLGAIGSAQTLAGNGTLKRGDALNDYWNHIVLYNGQAANGQPNIIEQTPPKAVARTASWSYVGNYRPIRRNNLSEGSGGTGANYHGYVRTGSGYLNVRSGPSTVYATVGSLADNQQVGIECRTDGQTISGTQGTTNQWYRLGTSQFASAAYVEAASAVPICGHENLVSNHGFESGSLSPWQCNGYCGVDVNLGSARSGDNNAWVRNDQGWNDIHQTLAVEPNTDYTLSAWVRTSSSNQSGYFGIRTTGGQVVAEQPFAQISGYQQLSVSFNSGSNSQLQVFTGMWANGDQWLQLDDYSLTRQ